MDWVSTGTPCKLQHYLSPISESRMSSQPYSPAISCDFQYLIKCLPRIYIQASAMAASLPVFHLSVLLSVILPALVYTTYVTEITTTITARSSHLPKRGPLPSNITPTMYSHPSQRSFKVPMIKPTCGRKTPPKIHIRKLTQSRGNAQFQQTYSVDWCRGDHKLRIRLLQIFTKALENGEQAIQTRVLAIDNESYFQSIQYAHLTATCKQIYFYIEACGKHPTKGDLCATSTVVKIKLPNPAVPEPRLAIRPPIVLRLSPGGTALVETRTTKDFNTGRGFSNGGYDSRGPHVLQMFAVSSSGKKLSSSAQVAGTNVSLVVGGSGTSWDASTVFTKYAPSYCSSNSASWRERYSTRIVVSRNVSALVKQDKRVPDFDQPEFPRTKIGGKPVTLKVSAKNNGGGRRADGSVTKMHYQWYVRNSDYDYSPTYARLIKGATKATFRVNADCVPKGCGPSGCSRLRLYFVDVCNTFGCRRSEPIEKNLIPPPLKKDEEWNTLWCEIDKKDRY